MADQVAVESAHREDSKDQTSWYPLRTWWRPYWLFNQDFGQPLIPEPGDLWWGTDRLQSGGSSGRPWPECTSSPFIVPLQSGSRYGRPPGPAGGQGELYMWRVVLDVAHFAPAEISISTADGALEIRGKHNERSDEHGFIARCFTRKYRLPLGIDLSKLTSVLSGDGILCVEAPLTDFTAPANIVIPIQVEREATELLEGEKEPEDSSASAPEDPGSTGPELPAEVTDHGEAPLAGVEAPTGSTMGEPPQHDVGREQEDTKEEEEVKEEEVKEEKEEVKDEEEVKEKEEVKDEEEVKEEKEEVKKEEEARGEVAEESHSSAAGVGLGPENPPELIEHHKAPEESPESSESPGTTPSHQEEEAGSVLLEAQPAESSGDAAVKVAQTDEPKEGESPSNQDTSQEPLAADTEREHPE
ncbi:Heat shock protein beta-1 [Merluccius polli]|uniref:Heat shock protein beta-1 n=1 Tax=Merluccius polli TaxID=89951 RepID=A0AA47NX33_MERPO|nr:Heat shock protein beta-1 [Merluccius polli]